MHEANFKFLAIVLSVTIFTAGMMVSTFKVANSFVEVKGSNSITVTGSAKQQIESDLIVWQSNISREAPTAAEAYTQLEKDKAVVLDYLNTNQVKNEEVTVSSVYTMPIYELNYNGMNTNKVLSYRLSQTIEVRSSNVKEVTELSRNITELLQKGLELQSNPPQYYYTKIADLKVEMLAEATKDAKLRAEKIADSTSSRIGKLKSAKMGVMQITPLYSTEISDYGINDTSSLQKEITAVVTCNFEMK